MATFYSGTSVRYNENGGAIYTEIAAACHEFEEVADLFKLLAKEGKYQAGDGLQIFENQYAEEKEGERLKISTVFVGEATLVRPGMLRFCYGTHG